MFILSLECSRTTSISAVWGISPKREVPPKGFASASAPMTNDKPPAAPLSVKAAANSSSSRPEFHACPVQSPTAIPGIRFFAVQTLLTQGSPLSDHQHATNALQFVAMFRQRNVYRMTSVRRRGVGKVSRISCRVCRNRFWTFSRSIGILTNTMFTPSTNYGILLW